MKLIISLFLALVVALLYAAGEHLFNSSKEEAKFQTWASFPAWNKKPERFPFFSLVNYKDKNKDGKVVGYSNGWAKAAAIGCIAGAVHFTVWFFANSVVATFVAGVGLFIMIALYIYLMLKWSQAGGTFNEMVVYILLALALLPSIKVAAEGTASMFAGIGRFGDFILRAPTLMLVAAVGYFIINRFYDLFKMDTALADRAKADTADQHRYDANMHHTAAIIAIALTTIVLLSTILSMFVVGFNWPTWYGFKYEVAESAEETLEPLPNGDPDPDEYLVAEVEPVTEEEVVQEPIVEATWYRFFHYDLLKDDDISNDFNFGPSLYYEGVTEEEVLAKIFALCDQDPMLGVGMFVGEDVILGLDFLEPGVHYDQDWSPGYWTTKINRRARYYTNHQDEYLVALERWEHFVTTYAKVELVYMENITDQLYAHALTANNEWETPEIIVCDSLKPADWVLKFTYLIKGNEHVVYRSLSCGGQLTNAAEAMKETPQPAPVNPNGAPEPTEAPEPKPTDAPEPAPEPTKAPDPTATATPIPTATPTPGPTATVTPRPTATPTPRPTATATPRPTATPTPIPTATPTPKPKAPREDPVNQGNAQKGGGQNKVSNGSGEVQTVDPRIETPVQTGPEEDNHHGYSKPETVVPPAPTVVPEHQQEAEQEIVVDYENKMTYELDVPTDNGPANPAEEPTSEEGDGEFVPFD